MQDKLLGKLAFICVTIPALFAGCGDNETGHRDVVGVGTVTLPLVATSSTSRTFVLCQGNLEIQSLANTNSWAIDAAAHATEQSVSQPLPAGDYTLSLSDWQLCEATGAAILPIDAQLESAAQLSFHVYPLQTTYLNYSFVVEEVTVGFGGSASIQINVREGSFAGAAGVGGQGNLGGAAGGGAGGSAGANALLDACVASCTQERATAFHPDPDGSGSIVSCAATQGSSCSTYCTYETGSRDSYMCARSRGWITSCCPEARYDFYVCAAMGSWTCVEISAGYFRSQAPVGCVMPSACPDYRR